MVSETHQVEEPPQFYGGIIADPMGLGKTLTMIALAATDLEEGFNAADQKWNANVEPYVKATLIIIPPPCELCCFIDLFQKLTASPSTGGLGKSNSLGICSTALMKGG